MISWAAKGKQKCVVPCECILAFFVTMVRVAPASQQLLLPEVSYVDLDADLAQCSAASAVSGALVQDVNTAPTLFPPADNR